MEFIEIEQRPMTQDKMRQLADKVREAACESVENLWSAVLDVVDMDTAQCFEQALAALMELRSYEKGIRFITPQRKENSGFRMENAYKSPPPTPEPASIPPVTLTTTILNS